jgi:hypothetical protein
MFFQQLTRTELPIVNLLKILLNSGGSIDDKLLWRPVSF